MKRLYRRSEYQHALNLARKARRRGDVMSSERWLRQADRYLASDDRLQASIDEARRKSADLVAKRSRMEEERNVRKRDRYLRQMEDEIDRINAMEDEDKEASEKWGADFPPSKGGRARGGQRW